jgi:hypothetical protein
MLNKDNLYYKLKYLKYKNKYLNYKKGGAPTVTLTNYPTQTEVLARHEEREKKENELVKQIKKTYDTMYPPSKDVPYLVSVEDITGSINLGSFIRGNQQLEKIQFIIFIKMEFRDLSSDDFTRIMHFVYTDQLFTSDTNGNINGINKDVLDIIKKYILDTLIPNLIIDLLDSSLIQKFENIQGEICIKISRIDAQIKQYLPNIKLFGDLDCTKFGSLTWISGEYIIKNDKLFNRLANSIEETEDEKGGRKLRRFIECVISSDMDVSPKIDILKKIEEELIPLYNKYRSNIQCRRTGRWITGIINRDVSPICYKYKHAKNILEEVEKQKKILESEMSEKIEKEGQYSEKIDKLYRDKKDEYTKLKEIINELINKIDNNLLTFYNLKEECLLKFTQEERQQLDDDKQKSLNEDVPKKKYILLTDYYGKFKGIDKDCNLRPYTKFLSDILFYLEKCVKELKEKYEKEEIPIMPITSQTIV